MMSIRKKTIVALTLACLPLFSMVANAQTWSEWFSQKKTQQKYLLEQVAALKVYAGYLKKGYQVGSSGLNFIRGASKGEFDLHGAFFNSLKSVRPEIRRNAKIAEIIRMQLRISRAFSTIEKLESLGNSNRVYAASVGSNLLLDCLGDMDELLLVVSSGKVEMGDSERLARIDKLYTSVQEKETFALGFCAEACSIARSRDHELKNLKEIEVWYEK